MGRSDHRPGSVLAVIPARGGSKGIPRKNIISFMGVPLIVHSIKQARNCDHIDRVIVSTDDQEIAAIARSAGAEVPFLRPPQLAEDHVLDLPVFEHVLDELRTRENYSPTLVVHLRPTAPYRRVEWLSSSIEAFRHNEKADSLRSVSEVIQHPYRMFEIGADDFLVPIMKHQHPIPYVLRRQDLPKIYYYNCVIDITRPETIVQKKSMTGDRLMPFVMNSDDVFDLDTLRDLQFAEFSLKGRL